jgi:molybdopterin/thiamine biosynthesis adenylyltransferase
MAAQEDVTTTRLTVPDLAAACSTLRVPLRAGSTRSFWGSLTVIWKGDAVCIT